ncbi:restriction endonuclease subunit S [Muribaculaceae bacterium Isolate-037 (Harlan)]|jgi:type I restriction enzyme S subunit|nr:restriction endonuclease subunit S [Muribaculaceae bacterium Isolate-037 (Harlan)]THG49115.1 restriction endonuclease subunit S [Bacteroidales bacterium]TKC54259.1 restriction endonuclease subunit S [Bacteroidales bacterium]
METYSEYKNSGQAWLGEIPSHWELLPGKAIFLENKRKNWDNSESFVLSLSYGRIIPKINKDEGLVPDNYSNYQIIDPNFIIIRCTDLQNDKVSLRTGLVRHHGIISGAYLGLIPRRGNNPIYLHYVLYYWDVSKELYRYGSGLRQSLSWFDIKYLQIPIPPICEQEAIVEYLDNVIAEIDKAIEAKERIIAALEERRKIIITEAVTRGINPNVPLRESGIEWLGQIPAHWETIPVRHVFEFRNGYTPSKINPSFWSNGTIPWFRMEDIRKSGRKLERAIQYITPAALNNGGTFDAGSFIMAICTASIGEHAMLIADSLANQQFANLKIRKSLSARFDSQFIFYYMYVLGKYCRDTANTTTFQYADMTLVKNFLVPIPSLEEQKNLVEYLDYNTKGIDLAIVQQKRLIDLLRERKNIIINEIVTGKVKVI